MRKLAKIIILVLVFNLLAPLAGRAQEPQTKSVERLKDEIQKMEAVDQNPSTPPEIKELNRSFLAERRRQLYLALKKTKDALEVYLTSVAASLTPAEIQTVG